MSKLTKTIKELTDEDAIDIFGGDAENIVEELNEQELPGKEWRDFYKKPGAIKDCESIEWLKGGCPKCGCKKWEATSDYWVYCMGCSKGYHTAYSFTRELIEELDFSTPQKTKRRNKKENKK